MKEKIITNRNQVALQTAIAPFFYRNWFTGAPSKSHTHTYTTIRALRNQMCASLKIEMNTEIGDSFNESQFTVNNVFESKHRRRFCIQIILITGFLFSLSFFSSLLSLARSLSPLHKHLLFPFDFPQLIH